MDSSVPPRGVGVVAPALPRRYFEQILLESRSGPSNPLTAMGSSSVCFPVLFLHAFPLDARMWEDQKVFVRESLKTPPDRILAPHHPGFGGVPTVAGGLDAFAAGAVNALDRAGVDRAVVVGLSMGGYVAFRLYACWPQRVAALVLADTRAGRDDEAARARRTEQAARVRREGVGWLGEVLLPSLLGETTRRERPEVVEGVRRMVLGANPEGVAAALEAMRDRPDSTPLLPSISVPVLAVAGEEDTLTPPEEARKIAGRVPRGRFLVLPGAGHLSNLERPDAFNAALAEFLSSLRAP